MHIRAKESNSSLESDMIIPTVPSPNDDSEVDEKTTTPENSCALQLSSVTRKRRIDSNQIERVRLSSRPSNGEIKLGNMIREINEMPALD
ncbi:unnamed protein product, partial [Rotaria sp. Silwood2]